MKLIHSGYPKQTRLVFSRHKIKWWGFLETKPFEELSEEEWISNLPVEHRGAEVDTGKHWRQKMPRIFVRWVMFRAGCFKFGITDVWDERILCCGVYTALCDACICCCSVLQNHFFPCPKDPPCWLFVPPSPPLPATSDLFTVSIVLPFPESHAFQL